MCWPTRTTSRNDGNGFRPRPGAGPEPTTPTGDGPGARAGAGELHSTPKGCCLPSVGHHHLSHRVTSRSVTPNLRGPNHTPFALMPVIRSYMRSGRLSGSRQRPPYGGLARRPRGRAPVVSPGRPGPPGPARPWPGGDPQCSTQGYPEPGTRRQRLVPPHAPAPSPISARAGRGPRARPPDARSGAGAWRSRLPARHRRRGPRPSARGARRRSRWGGHMR